MVAVPPSVMLYGLYEGILVHTAWVTYTSVKATVTMNDMYTDFGAAYAAIQAKSSSGKAVLISVRQCQFILDTF